MKKIILLLSLTIILILLIGLSGCQENSNNNNSKIDTNVHFISKDLQILELVNSSVEITKNDNDEISQVQVFFKFKNLLDKSIENIKMDIAFLDSNDNVLYNYTYNYPYFPADYTEDSLNPSRTFSDSGVENFEYVNLKIIDYKIEE